VTAAILGRVMLAFEGETLPPRIAARLAAAPAAGMTLFRAHNVRSPGQVLELAGAFQRAGAGQGTIPERPMLVAADQEGGQFIALGEATTPFAGNMALGAVDDEGLTERVAFAIGLEARAMGVNVVYAPCLDLATNPSNPAIGIRAFGDRPAQVAGHGVAFVRGLQAAGVAGAVKHFPGIGDLAADTHHVLDRVDEPRSVLDAREFVPFRTAFRADRGGAPRLAMSGHVGLPAVTGRADLPATLSRAVMTDLLRGDLGFAGLTISDALDMGAITGAAYGAGAEAGVPDVVAALDAGIDLLLASADAEALERIETALVRAAAAGVIEADAMADGDRRLDSLRRWLGSHGPLPDLAVVGSREHADLAAELAARSITLVGDTAGVLPIPRGSLDDGGRILAVMPRPADLTPADTSSLVRPGLADALRADHADVEACVVDQRPDPGAIAAVRGRARDAAFVVIGTIDGHRQLEQLALVEAVAATGVPTIAVALRGPWDVLGYPPSVAALATYSILPPSLRALADVLAGRASAPGRLPVTISR
jgi:beta-N-acetylhexosaminidase